MPKMIDVTGEVFGRLTAIEPIRQRGKKEIYWRCQCSCGKLTLVMAQNLREGKIQSCGCYKAERVSTRLSVHRHSRIGAAQKPSPEYKAWCAMRDRCNRQNHIAYKNYGGRGIKVCSEWEASFTAFLAHIGPKPTPAHTVDRINVDGNYAPGNVRWATRKEQAANKRPRI
jgi:hypothetical protein